MIEILTGSNDIKNPNIQKCHPALIRLAKECLQENPDHRPTVAHLLQECKNIKAQIN